MFSKTGPRMEQFDSIFPSDFFSQNRPRPIRTTCHGSPYVPTRIRFMATFQTSLYIFPLSINKVGTARNNGRLEKPATVMRQRSIYSPDKVIDNRKRSSSPAFFNTFHNTRMYLCIRKHSHATMHPAGLQEPFHP